MDTSTDHGRHLQKEGVPPSAYQTGPGVTSQVEGFLPQAQPPQLLTKKRLEDVLHEIEPNQLLDEDVTEVLLQMADDFIESVVASSCDLAKHRKSSTLEAKDVQLHLERSWNMWIPGYGVDDKAPKKSLTTEAHRQRMNLIKKTSKGK
jgi:transcription initiation factor TFIID subunit 12